MELLTDPEVWVALITLTALEIVLGIDNIIFISIMASKLPPDQRQKARLVGLSAAMIMRIALLLSIAVIVGLTAPLFSILDHPFSGRDLILIGGGLFLLAKSTMEIHERLEGPEDHKGGRAAGIAAVSFTSVIVQIMLLDIIFSLDSVITAVGMADHVAVMVVAIVIAVLVMMVSSGRISEFIERHPSLKMLALAFLLLIGTSLVAEGFHVEIPKGYVYGAMAFSVFVEFLNIRGRSRPPVQLRHPYYDPEEQPADKPPADKSPAAAG